MQGLGLNVWTLGFQAFGIRVRVRVQGFRFGPVPYVGGGRFWMFFIIIASASLL